MPSKWSHRRKLALSSENPTDGVVLAWTAVGGSITSNYIAIETEGSWPGSYDTSWRRWFSKHGSSGATNNHIIIDVPGINPNGRMGGLFPNFDLDINSLELDLNYGYPDTNDHVYNCYVVEFLAKFVNERAVDTARGAGITSNGDNTAPYSAQFAIADKHIAVIRTANGWTITSSDGTTKSETAESADTADGNQHVFRLEWHDKVGTGATEARLYVDNVLKVTKTTNLPNPSDSVPPSRIVFSALDADPADDFWWACSAAYYKRSTVT